jgi:Ras-related protein Rab-1A
LVVYDITDQKSFNNVKSWLQEIATHANASVVKLLVGNKCDLSRQRVVQQSDVSAFAESVSVSQLEASAKSGEGIETVFRKLVSLIMDAQRKNPSLAAATPNRPLIGAPNDLHYDDDGCAC